LAEPSRTTEELAIPTASVRNAGGSIARFDEIVTPHPVAAFLFRRRTLIVLLAMVWLAFFARPTSGPLAVGFVLAVVAEAWRIWSAGTIHKTETLTTGGPYAYVRHPLYVGSFVHAVAFCLMSGRWESFLVVPPLFAALYGAAVAIEEAMLRKLFGEQYEAYSRRVPRFIPRLRAAEPGHGRFDWRQVMANKEYVNIIWIIMLSSLFAFRLISGR
jgi:protein-S-isoprenylcysteine O-methyltransferase Ste14